MGSVVRRSPLAYLKTLASWPIIAPWAALRYEFRLESNCLLVLPDITTVFVDYRGVGPFAENFAWGGDRVQ